MFRNLIIFMKNENYKHLGAFTPQDKYEGLNCNNSKRVGKVIEDQIY